MAFVLGWKFSLNILSFLIASDKPSITVSYLSTPQPSPSHCSEKVITACSKLIPVHVSRDGSCQVLHRVLVPSAITRVLEKHSYSRGWCQSYWKAVNLARYLMVYMNLQSLEIYFYKQWNFSWEMQFSGLRALWYAVIKREVGSKLF